MNISTILALPAKIFLFSLFIIFFPLGISTLNAQNLGSAMSIESSSSKIPVCKRNDSDSDGDGWGWENMKSCRVGEVNEVIAHPICQSATSDPDGDGWGWENKKSCKVEESSNTIKDNQSINFVDDTDRDRLKVNIKKIEGEGSSDVYIGFEFEAAGPAFIEYGYEEDSLEFVTDEEINNLTFHRQRIRNVDSSRQHYFVINSNGARSKIFTFNDSNSSVNQIDEPSTEPAVAVSTQPNIVADSVLQTSTSSGSATFQEIERNGLSNGCYPNEDHYVAEYLYQNPDTCFWKVDNENKTITTIDIPAVPSNAVKLPSPSGGDDTKALEKIINASKAKAVVGNGTYKINGLNINVPVDIFHMKMEPTSTARNMVIVNSPDVRIFHSPIDGKNSNYLAKGFTVNYDSHRFVLVKSGMSNIWHTKGESAAGVYIRGVDDFHIACNKFENIINATGDKTKLTRANTFYINGGSRSTTSGGYIVNNYAKNNQGNGADKAGEFLTRQSFTSTDSKNPIRVFANRAIDAGKRLTKNQESDAVILSNYYEWDKRDGPLGRRFLLSHVTVHFSDNIIARNNRVVVAAKSEFDYILRSDVNVGKKRQDNLHYDCNDIEIKDKLSPTSNNYPMILSFIAHKADKNSTAWEATNSSAKNNYIHGAGSVKHHYWFGNGYRDFGEGIDTSGNIFEIPALISEYRR